MDIKIGQIVETKSTTNNGFVSERVKVIGILGDDVWAQKTSNSTDIFHKNSLIFIEHRFSIENMKSIYKDMKSQAEDRSDVSISSFIEKMEEIEDETLFLNKKCNNLIK